ncbi:hypothetical protein [Streptomyces sp. NPDC058751]|uniref:hypothetical protein n=1 Tax=Streptomyces sp. NPDC058751 TaxID=3346623 RepID=UPI00369DC1E8
MKRRVLTVLGGVAASTLLTIGTASAATEIDTADAAGWPGGAFTPTCASTDEVQGCFRPDGEWFSILDREADGHSAVIVWRLVNNEEVVRNGSIWHTAGANPPVWRYQNKSFPEHYIVEFKVCIGEASNHDVWSDTCSPYEQRWTSS